MHWCGTVCNGLQIKTFLKTHIEMGDKLKEKPNIKGVEPAQKAITALLSGSLAFKKLLCG